MIEKTDQLFKDFEAVGQIPIVPMMLEIICRTTGMGFAAVARVTDTRWLACSVRDEVSFGLGAGDELKIETTICNEIRDSRQPVIIDHVDKDENYQHHHTPKTYGLQSYISFPIILKNGDFFGTLCAIDSKPALLKNPAITGTFTLFAELLSFHLQSIELMDRSRSTLEESTTLLSNSQDENRLYRQISHHNLQEPLRKIRFFSDKLLNADLTDTDEVRKNARKINLFSNDLAGIIRDITDFSALELAGAAFEMIDLNKMLPDISSRMDALLKEKDILIRCDSLPSVFAIPSQMEQLFFQMLSQVATLTKAASVIRVYSSLITPDQAPFAFHSEKQLQYCEIVIEDKELVFERNELEKLFDVFAPAPGAQQLSGHTAGFAHCRKIVHNHGGSIKAQSAPGTGTVFSIILPLNRNVSLSNRDKVYRTT